MCSTRRCSSCLHILLFSALFICIVGVIGYLRILQSLSEKGTTFDYALAWNTEGTLALYDGAGNVVLLTEDLQQIARLETDSGDSVSVTWNPQGNRLISAHNSGGAGMTLWRVDTNSGLIEFTVDASFSEELALRQETGPPVAWSPNEYLVAIGGRDKTLRILDVINTQDQLILEGHSELVYTVSWNPDGNQVASGSSDGTVRIWDVAAGQEVFHIDFEGNPISSISWHSFDSILAVAADRVSIWNTDTKQLEVVLPVSGQSVKWSPANNRLMVLRSGKIEIWDTDLEQVETILEIPGSFVRDAIWSPDGRRCVGISNDGIAYLWDVPTNSVLAIYDVRND